MLSLEDIQGKIAALTSVVAAAKAEVQDMLTSLKTTVATMSAQASVGAIVPAADFTALGASLDDLIVKIQGISEPALAAVDPALAPAPVDPAPLAVVDPPLV